MLPGPFYARCSLNDLVFGAQVTNSHVPMSRWDVTEARGAYASAAYGAFVSSGAFSSDAAAFGISRTEASGLEPQMMLVLETSYSVFHDPRLCCRASLANAPVGFFLGAGGSVASSANTIASPNTATSDKGPSVYSGTSGALSVASGRVSYTLGLTGPCLTLDTACSSSLVAAHLAVSALALVECPRAGVTGVGILTALVFLAFSAAGMLSGLGRSHAFDRRADGYCRGEGCGAFGMASEMDGGTLVCGSAVQQDGPSASLTAPNGSSQRRLIAAVRGDGGALEAHGTGTALGDPIEVS